MAEIIMFMAYSGNP